MIYAVALMAWRHDGTDNHVRSAPFLVSADSEEEATRGARRFVRIAYPVKDGWHHSILTTGDVVKFPEHEDEE